jgi:hypothetical protein
MQRFFTELDVGTTRISIARLDLRASTGAAASMQTLSVDSISSINAAVGQLEPHAGSRVTADKPLL